MDAGIKLLLEILILFTAIPTGLILKKICSEEIQDGKKWFRIIAITSWILVILIAPIYLEMGLTFAYLGLISVIALIKIRR